MLCSCGQSGSKTPAGNYSIKKKWRWQQLFHGVSGQYVSQFNGNYLFHSVVYKYKNNSSSCIRTEYNKLGRNASHGCVRLATMDAKWIYENCSRGTKVTIYGNSDPGPLGKPARVAMKGTKSRFWDPTDPISTNKYFNMTGPVISINKSKSIEYGKTFSIYSGVTAKNPYTFQKLTSSVKLHKIRYRASGQTDYELVTKVNTKVPGTYKITYKCYNKYCGRKTVFKSFVLTVKPAPEPDTEDVAVPDTEDTTVPDAGTLQ